MRTLRLLQPVALAHCVRRALPTLRLAHWLPPAQGALPGGRGLGVRCHPDRSRRWRWRMQTSQVPGGTLMKVRLVLRPRWDRWLRPLGPAARPPQGTRARAPDEKKNFRGSMARRSFWLSTLRGRDRSGPRKTRFRLSATLPGGIGYPQGPDRRFPRHSRYISSSFSRLCLAQRPLFPREAHCPPSGSSRTVRARLAFSRSSSG
jgi:hypothetical protein